MDQSTPLIDAPHIVAGRLPLYETGGEFNSPVIGAFVAISMISYLRFGDVAAVGAVAVGFLPVALIVGGTTWYRFHTRLLARPSPQPPTFRRTGSPPPVMQFSGDKAAAAIVALLEQSRRYHVLREPTMWSWRDFQHAIEKRGSVRPRTIVDEATHERLCAIPLPVHLFEPEAILTSGEQPRGRVIGGMIAAVIATLLLLALGLGWLSLLPLAFAATLSLQLPEARDILRLFHLHQSETIVGLGAVTDKHKRRWTADDAVMVVQCRRAAGPLIVTLIGKAGRFVLTFTDERDPDFVRLWQGWNHPLPRPDLLPEA